MLFDKICFHIGLYEAFVIIHCHEETSIVCSKLTMYFFMTFHIVKFDFYFRYHLGSLAFGSLIIAIIQIIRVLLEYVDGKLKGSENAVAKFFLK